LRYAAEPLQGIGRRVVLVLCDAQRPDRLPVQPHLRHLQVRIHGGRLLHHVLQRRQGLLRDFAVLLRNARVLPEVRLLLLRLLQQHALLLRDVLKAG
jgi:hypothetical protein